MKQILQNLSDGKTIIEEVPVPKLNKDTVLINSSYSLISKGTEKMLIDFGRGNYIEKALQQPDKVKMVIEKAKVDGIKTTYDAVRSKLDEPIPLGYCNAGVILESGTSSFKKGDRVISNGYHAEVVRVGKNLCAKIPKNVDDQSAAFSVLASISLQGIRLVKPNIGETVVVSGLGLVGLMAVQILIANGCKVIGIDFDSSRCELAESFGAASVDLSKNEDPVDFVNQKTNNVGADAIVIAASSKSNQVIHQAAEMCRQRGKIVLIGVVGLNLIRDDFFKKEITFQVSASYGPGRYDPLYEENGIDYPIGYVRWTEQRNFEAVLDMMSNGSLNVKPLISQILPIEKALDAYDELNNDASLGTLIKYSSKKSPKDAKKPIVLNDKDKTQLKQNKAVISFIGAGNYASRTLIPAFKKSKASFLTIASSTGISGTSLGKRFGFKESTTDTNKLFQDKHSNTIVITTRHNSHAKFILEGIKYEKNIFVEKPLCTSLAELDQIQNAYYSLNDKKYKPIIMVGFNRRFSPQIKKMKQLLDSTKEKKTFIMTINAGSIPIDHWTQDIDIGGGRIIGEACHFIDLLRFLSDSEIFSWHQVNIDSDSKDTISISLKFKNGSIGTIHYLSNGSNLVSKERLEVFTANKILQLDNYRKLSGYGWSNFKKLNLWNQDKGQNNCVQEFVDAISENQPSPIPFEEIIEVSRVAIEIADSI